MNKEKEKIISEAHKGYVCTGGSEFCYICECIEKALTLAEENHKKELKEIQEKILDQLNEGLPFADFVFANNRICGIFSEYIHSPQDKNTTGESPNLKQMRETGSADKPPSESSQKINRFGETDGVLNLKRKWERVNFLENEISDLANKGYPHIVEGNKRKKLLKEIRRLENSEKEKTE